MPKDSVDEVVSSASKNEREKLRVAAVDHVTALLFELNEAAERDYRLVHTILDYYTNDDVWGIGLQAKFYLLDYNHIATYKLLTVKVNEAASNVEVVNNVDNPSGLMWADYARLKEALVSYFLSRNASKNLSKLEEPKFVPYGHYPSERLRIEAIACGPDGKLKYTIAWQTGSSFILKPAQ